MRYSLRQLELFRLLMQTRNVTETARLLSISQPAASQTLKDLEAQLNLQLFVRSGGRMQPTAEARAMVQEVERLFVQMAAVSSRATELRDAYAGSLTVASIPTLTGSIIPQALALLRAERPRVRLTMDAHDGPEVIRRTWQESIDLGVLYGPINEPQVAAEPLLRTRMVCIMPADHHLAQADAVELRQLVQETVIMHPTTTPSLLPRAQRRGAGAGTDATILVNLSFGGLALVRQRLGVFVTEPLILLSGLTEGLVARRLEPELPLTMFAVYSRRRPVPRVVVRFMGDLRHAIATAAQQLSASGIASDVM